MSFGFSITDFKEVIKLSWNLYESLKECPHEIKDLAKDFTTIYGVLSHIEHDLATDDSTIRTRGEAGMKLLQTMTLQLKATTVEVQKLVDGFRPMAARSKNHEQLWLKIKWTVGQKKINRLRQDIAFHISGFTLLMTSMGNSSLLRIETSLAEMRASASAVKDRDNEVPSIKGRTAEYTSNADSTPEIMLANEVESTTPTLSQGFSTSRSTDPEQMNQHENSESLVLSQRTDIGSPHWLEPQVVMPSAIFKRNVLNFDKLSPGRFVQIIFQTSQKACIEFYRINKLERTKYDDHGHPLLLKIFAFFVGNLYETSQDLTLRDWLQKIQRAVGRLEKSKAISYSMIYDSGTALRSGFFSKTSRILSVESPWKTLDIDNAEDGLLLSLELCRHLHWWTGVGVLKKLWLEFHMESPNVEELESVVKHVSNEE